MDQALKQRLIGAAIIVAVVVLVVPVFLEGPGERDATQDITLPESPEVEREPRLLPLNQSPADDPEPVEAQAQPVDESLAPPQTYPQSGGRDASPVVDEPAAVQSREPEESPEEAQPEQADSTPPDEPVEEEPVAEASEPEAAPEATEPERSSEVDEVAVADGSFAVQVGGFSSEDNAMGLRDRLRDAGFPTYVELYRGGSQPIYRVRVGPAVDRTAAEGLLQRLQAEMEMNGMVVTHP